MQVQKQTRLCITRDLSEKDVVSRIMRKENYLIGMLNKVTSLVQSHRHCRASQLGCNHVDVC